MARVAVQMVTGGRGFTDPLRTRPGYQDYHKLEGAGPAPPRFQGDGTLTFDRLTDVYHSGTRHEEDQPCHLHVLDLNICVGCCVHRIREPLPVFLPGCRL